MDIDAHKPSESPSLMPPDPIGADFADSTGRDSTRSAKAAAERYARFIMPSAEAIAEAIIRRASADLRG
jgi:hypothetical protein